MKYHCFTSYLMTFLVLYLPQTALASLAVHPISLRDTVAPGGTGTLTLHITNRGPSNPLGYSVTDTSDWLASSPTSGQIAIGETLSVIITIDASLLQSGAYHSEVTVIDPHHGPIVVPLDLVVQSVTRVNEGREARPVAFALETNYPNPFNPATTIGFSLPRRGHLVLSVFNLLGQHVATLVKGEQDPGYHEVVWNAEVASTGVYLYQLQTEGGTLIRKMILAK